MGLLTGFYPYPNQPNFISPDLIAKNFETSAWVGERKKNGWRCLAIKTGGELILWTRHKTVISDPLPITRGALSIMPDDTIIDGELIDKRTKDTKDLFYAFDILVLKGERLFNKPWKERRDFLEQTTDDMDGIIVSVPISVGKAFLYDLAVDEGDEGIVLKNIHSKYLFSAKTGITNPLWVKAKRPEPSFKTGGEK